MPSRMIFEPPAERIGQPVARFGSDEGRVAGHGWLPTFGGRMVDEGTVASTPKSIDP
jgi:hypothetical protein